jgi:hypothetical protein
MMQSFWDSISQLIKLISSHVRNLVIYNSRPQHCWNSINYIQSIILNNKNFNIATTDHACSTTDIQAFDDELHLYLLISNEQSMMINLIETLNIQNIWFNIYSCEPFHQCCQDLIRLIKIVHFSLISSDLVTILTILNESWKLISSVTSCFYQSFHYNQALYRDQASYEDHFFISVIYGANNNQSQNQSNSEQHQLSELRVLLQITAENERRFSEQDQNQWQNGEKTSYWLSYQSNHSFNQFYQPAHPWAYHTQSNEEEALLNEQRNIKNLRKSTIKRSIIISLTQ